MAAKSPAVKVAAAGINWWQYTLFMAAEVGWWIPWIFINRKQLCSKEQRMLILCLSILCLLPLLRMPGILDFIMRASLPALLLLFITCATVFSRMELKTVLSKFIAVMTLLFLLGSWITPISEITRAVRFFKVQPPLVKQSDQVPQLERNVAMQYLGQSDTLFFQHLLKNRK